MIFRFGFAGLRRTGIAAGCILLLAATWLALSHGPLSPRPAAAIDSLPRAERLGLLVAVAPGPIPRRYASSDTGSAAKVAREGGPRTGLEA